jgi:hypothetical protein
MSFDLFFTLLSGSLPELTEKTISVTARSAMLSLSFILTHVYSDKQDYTCSSLL